MPPWRWDGDLGGGLDGGPPRLPVRGMSAGSTPGPMAGTPQRAAEDRRVMMDNESGEARMKRMIALIGCLGTLWGLPLGAEPILPPGRFPATDAAIARQLRQFRSFHTLPFGLSLNVHVKDLEARERIQAFLDQQEVEDFRQFAGRHPYEEIAMFGEHGDLGFFGGVALAGTAFRYRALRREGAPEAELARARADLIRAAESWHVFYVVTGGQGVVARGIWRLQPEDPEAPPIPGLDLYHPVPLFDDQGNPLPRPKDNGSDRYDHSGGVLPPGVWGWIDSASKDQLTGQVLGLVALYDAMKDDPDVDQALVERLAEDARGVGRMLMQKREISGLENCTGEGEYDLIIWDADGRPTMHHDLNPLSFEKFYLPEGSAGFNVLNLVLATGILRGLHHVTGDPEIEAFLYDEFLGRRGYLDKMRHFESPDALNYIYMGLATNTDNPDLVGVALFLALYTETDPEVASVFRRFLQEGWWAPATEPRFCASKSKQPLWDAIYLAVTDRGTPEDVRQELAALLPAFPLGGYWQDERINCDDQEIAQGWCLAIDGKTVITLAGTEPGGRWLATEALDPSIRPNSDFNARSNAFHVNGGGDGRMLGPGGDLLAAYWMARALDVQPPGSWNRSPFARTHRPVPGSRPEEVPEETGGGDPGPADPGSESSPDLAPGPDGDLPAAVEDVPDAGGSGTDAAPGGDALPDAGAPRMGGGCRASSPGGAGGPWTWLVPLAAWGLRRRRSGVGPS